MVKALRILGYLWVGLAVLVLLVSIVGGYMAAESFWAFWDWLTTTFSPFNIANFIALMVLLAPAFGIFILAEKLERRQLSKRIEAAQREHPPATEGEQSG